MLLNAMGRFLSLEHEGIGNDGIEGKLAACHLDKLLAPFFGAELGLCLLIAAEVLLQRFVEVFLSGLDVPVIGHCRDCFALSCGHGTCLMEGHFKLIFRNAHFRSFLGALFPLFDAIPFKRCAYVSRRTFHFLGGRLFLEALREQHRASFAQQFLARLVRLLGEFCLYVVAKLFHG